MIMTANTAKSWHDLVREKDIDRKERPNNSLQKIQQKG